MPDTLQLLGKTRAPLPAQPERTAKEGYECQRCGTRNIFVAVEPKGGHRWVSVTLRRKKADFVSFAKHLVENVYSTPATVSSDAG